MIGGPAGGVGAAFLDRDGVLNAAVMRDGRPHPPDGPDRIALLPGVPEACQRLKDEGLLIVVVTNQPDVARCTTTLAEVEAINQRLLDALPIDAVYVCPHDDHHGCRCRKPQPGLLLDAAADLGIALERSTMVGDRWRDIDAGRAARVATVFLDRFYDERRPERPDAVAAELIDAVPFILRRSAKETP